jgi:hypothetical protein
VTSMSALSVIPQNELILPPNATADARLLRKQLIGLTRAMSHTDISDLNKVSYNLELAGVMLACLSQESWQQVADTNQLAVVMAEYVCISTLCRVAISHFPPGMASLRLPQISSAGLSQSQARTCSPR